MVYSCGSMNLEQVEGQLNEFKGKSISVAVPIRGTVHQTFYGNLEISHDWENHTIIYSVRFYPDSDINFQAHDVHKIVPNPNEETHAAVILKSDTWLNEPTHVAV